METEQLFSVLSTAISARSDLLDEPHSCALRLFNGFYEGIPDLVVDLYGHTLVLYNYANQPESFDAWIKPIKDWFIRKLPWVQAIILKTRSAATQTSRCGFLIHGSLPAEEILENSVHYAIDLQMNQDASFYLDTRLLRSWLKENLSGCDVLNTFAYTGSLGAAALAGGAERVIQTDLSTKFLNLAKNTYALNGFRIARDDFLIGDFFNITGRLRHRNQLFHCVLLDAPFFSVTSGGKVDLVNQSQRLINKVRPLVQHGGWLVVINNSLFVSGVNYIRMLEEMCQDGYMRIEKLISIPEDITGFPHTIVTPPPVDPAPFNHSTKIVVLKVWRKGHLEN
jgi:23S rRNA (cytosine1962-C5)-methyltransferase